MARIKDLMEKHMVAVSRSASVGSAIRLMKDAHVSVVPVLDGTKLSGVLSLGEAERQADRWGDERDLADLNLRLIFVELKDTPEKAAKLMVANKTTRLPVVDTATGMKCVGVISATEIARNHKKKLL